MHGQVRHSITAATASVTLMAGTLAAQQPEMFAPGVISAPGVSETWITFAPDGRELYVSRYTDDFDQQTVYVARRQGDGWTVPEVAPFSGRFSDRAPRISPDGRRLLLSSNRPLPEGGGRKWRLWVLERTADGSWSEPRPLPAVINGGEGDRHGVLTADGSVYWAGVGRPGGLGRSDIYRAVALPRGGWGAPEHLPAPINTQNSEPDLWVAPDGSYMILVVTDRAGGYGGDDLWISHRVGAGWTEPRNLGGRVNTPDYEYGPTLSPDGEWLYYASRGDIYRMRTSALDLRQTRGRSLLDAALQAQGGEARLRGVRSMTVQVEGEIHWRHQSRLPGPPYDAWPFTAMAVLDWDRDRLLWQNRWAMPGGFGGHNRFVSTPSESFNVNVETGQVSAGGRAAAAAHPMNARLPHRVLLSVLEQPAALRWSHEVQLDGAVHDVVSARHGADAVDLYIDRGTRLLNRYAVLRAEEVAGDVMWEEIFGGYGDAGGFTLPGWWRREIDGVTAYEYSFDIAVDAPPADSLFDAPRSPGPAPAAGWPDRMLSEVAPGVWFLEGAAPSYNMMFVELGDVMVAFEAPDGSAVVEQALSQLRERVPGRAVRWAVATHHHDDHAGGMRALMAEGATIVAPPLSRAFYERMARTRRLLSPDRLAREPVAPRFETMQGDRHVLEGGGRTVEIHRIGGPHADEMLVMYIPHAGIIFQGDLMNAGGDLSLAPANETTAHFAQWLRRSGLRVERIFGVHSPARTPADLARALAMAEGR